MSYSYMEQHGENLMNNTKETGHNSIHKAWFHLPKFQNQVILHYKVFKDEYLDGKSIKTRKQHDIPRPESFLSYLPATYATEILIIICKMRVIISTSQRCCNS